MKNNLVLMLITVLPMSFNSATGQEIQIIPFRLTEYNNVSVSAILNEIDTVELMVHTAANSMTLTENAIKNLRSITFSGATGNVKSWGGKANPARTSDGNTVQIGDLLWRNVSIRENVNSGHGTDGKFGIDLFSEWCVHISYSESVLRLLKNLPPDIGSYEKMRIDHRDGDLFVEAQVNLGQVTIKNKFLIHSGYTGALLLDDSVARNSGLKHVSEVLSVQSLTDSYGNIVKVKKVSLPELTVGALKFRNIPAGFFDGLIEIQRVSIIGGDVLKRIDFIIDTRREFIYVKPSSLFNTEFKK